MNGRVWGMILMKELRCRRNVLEIGGGRVRRDCLHVSEVESCDARCTRSTELLISSPSASSSTELPKQLRTTSQRTARAGFHLLAVGEALKPSINCDRQASLSIEATELRVNHGFLGLQTVLHKASVKQTDREMVCSTSLEAEMVEVYSTAIFECLTGAQRIGMATSAAMNMAQTLRFLEGRRLVETINVCEGGWFKPQTATRDPHSYIR